MMHRYSISIVSNISFARSYNGSTASVPHAGHPCGRRHQRRTRPHSPTKFQSTPPARAATACPQPTERQALLDPVPRTAPTTPPLRRPHQIEIL